MSKSNLAVKEELENVAVENVITLSIKMSKKTIEQVKTKK